MTSVFGLLSAVFGRVAAPLPLLVFLAAVASAQPAPTKAALGEPFTLKPGGTAVVEGEDLQVGFERVVSDSRCPRGAQCITAGQAVVRVWVTKGAQERAAYELRTTPPAAAEAQAAGYRLKLVTLEPEPEVDRPVRPSDYLATLLVVR